MNGSESTPVYEATEAAECHTPPNFNMLINPEAHDFALRWHRDDVGEKASEEEEREALGKWRFGVSVHGHPTFPS